MIVACYLWPNITFPEYEEEIEALENLGADWGGPILYLGDFNAKSPAWGAKTQDLQGQLLIEFMWRLDLHPVRATRAKYTFCNGRGGRSLVDFAFCDAETL